MLFIDTCDTFALKLGYDMCLRSVGKFCRMRRSRQHLLDLQSEDTWRQCPCESWIVRTQWIPVMLPLPWRQPDRHELRRYDLVGCHFLPVCVCVYQLNVISVDTALISSCLLSCVAGCCCAVVSKVLSDVLLVMWTAVHCGTLRPVNRRRRSMVTLEMWWVLACLPMQEALCLEHVMPQQR